MPELIRARGIGRHIGPRPVLAVAAGLVQATSASAQSATAQASDLAREAFARVPWHEVAGLALTLGIILFAVISAILLLRTRAGAATERAAQQAEIQVLKAMASESRALLAAESQTLIVWPADGGEPQVHGEESLLGPGLAPERLIDFTGWLDPELAAELASAVETLRARGQG